MRSCKLHIEHLLRSVLPFLILCTFISTAQTNRVEDSLNGILAETTNDSLRMNLFNELRKATFYSEPDISKSYTKEYL
jgi:hypothetical protein